jgi:hypothetical protein
VYQSKLSRVTAGASRMKPSTGQDEVEVDQETVLKGVTCLAEEFGVTFFLCVI